MPIDMRVAKASGKAQSASTQGQHAFQKRQTPPAQSNLIALFSGHQTDMPELGQFGQGARNFCGCLPVVISMMTTSD
ncbi:MAG: hypothetical protein ACK4HF_18295 [Paracoccaceae bacterium]